MSVMIIGAGIGGLTAALSLHAAGIDVQVYESVVEMKAIGFGINLQPNAARELIELGLGRCIGRNRDRDRRTRLLQQARSTHMVGATRARRRLCMAAIRHRARRFADDPARCGQGEDRRGERV